ncbi:MAG: hypothetical protein H0V62_04085 [Gammaproteobacteria bacterium]|nr:hypothetical protein [Gammaproteobacteria bacterium]
MGLPDSAPQQALRAEPATYALPASASLLNDVDTALQLISADAESIKIIESRRRHISRKLDLHGPVDFTRYAIKIGLVRP